MEISESPNAACSILSIDMTEISGYYGCEYEDDSLLGHSAV
jgi:hypothetical protein